MSVSVSTGGLRAGPLTAIRARSIRAVPWFDVLVIAWLLLLYDAINNLAPLARASALRRARGVLTLEHSLHIDIELTLNRWLAHHPALGYLASTYYDLAHFLVTFGVLGLLWWKRRDLYKTMRTHLIVINLIAFAVFWRFPVAPPRMLPVFGFSDIVARTDALVSWHTGGLSHDANQYAAMPSLHVAWATWSALAIWRMVRRPLVRVIAVLMPLFTAFTVLATGNHFVLDVLAGAATFALAWRLTPLLHGLARRMCLLFVDRLGSEVGTGACAFARRGRHEHAPRASESWPADRRGTRRTSPDLTAVHGGAGSALSSRGCHQLRRAR